MSRIRTFLCLVLVFFLQCGISDMTARETGSSHDGLTRGIGIYPGSPAEDFSPRETYDDIYRNIALGRMAYASSNYDYNLTAQLVTDGILDMRDPCRLEVSVNGTPLPKREKEWMIDQNLFSNSVFYGDTVSCGIVLENYGIMPAEIVLDGSVAYDETNVSGQYSILVQASDNGHNWHDIGNLTGSGLPGRPAGKKVQDPNKAMEKIMLPVREFNERIRLTGSSSGYSGFRIFFNMPGSVQWNIRALDFYDGSGRYLNPRPSGHFRSCWMSSTPMDEWIYVDLGRKARFDKIRMSWVSAPEKARIQISDDSATWRDVCLLSEEKDNIDSVTFDRWMRARYVKILLESSSDGSNYALSELEIYGKGGTAHVPADCRGEHDGRYYLSGGEWRLQRASEVMDTGETVSTAGYDPEGWIPATVPGTVLSSFVNVGALPDPGHSDNQLQISESFFLSDFWYRDEFVLPDNFHEGNVFLNFDGINWKAEVFMNGNYVGSVEGAFMRGRFNVSGYLQPGENAIAVRIVKNENPGSVKEKSPLHPDYNGGVLGADNPTFHASVGWDWIPTVRGRNIGIWNDVYLEADGPVSLDAPMVRSILPLPDTTSAELTAEVIAVNNEARTVAGTVVGRIGDIVFSKDVVLRPEEMAEVTFGAAEFPQLRMDDPQLWWPNGYGEQNLYESSFTFIENGRTSDSISFNTGIRQMTYAEENGILNMYVNGVRFAGRGGNWGFSESNLNYRGREYDIAVRYHKEMNLNFIRNWVGMIADEEFYDACDRYGIMIWQDFWLANPVDGPDPYDEEMFVENAADYIKRIRRHPAVGLYCGRNEGYPPAGLNLRLEDLVSRYDPEIRYIPHSSSGPVSGGGPYWIHSDKDYFIMGEKDIRIHSERGLPNVMTYESVRRTFSDEGIWPKGNEWGIHDFTRMGAQNGDAYDIHVRRYGTPGSAREYCMLAQFVNYDAHRALFESRSRHRMGLLMWMSHPCWPSMVWQTYDYYFEPDAAYFGIRKAAEMLHIQKNAYTSRVEVVNYGHNAMPGLLAIVGIYDVCGRLEYSDSARVDIDADSTVESIQLPSDDTSPDIRFLKLELRGNGGNLISENMYIVGKGGTDYSGLENIPDSEVKVRKSRVSSKDGVCSVDLILENCSQVPAIMLRLDLVGREDKEQILPVIYSDNYFTLLPGESKKVKVTWRKEDARGTAGAVEVSGYNLAD